MTPRHALAAVAVAIIWGANFVVIDAGLHDMPPLTFVALRFVAVLIPAIFVVKRPDARWRDILLIGLFLSLGQFGLLYLSLHLGMPPGLASLVVQVQVIFTVVIAALALHERPTRRQQVGVLVGLVGLTVVALGRTADTPLLAVVLCLTGALSWATGNVVTRRVGTASGLSMTVWSGLVVPVPLFALSLVVDGPEAVASGLRHIDAVTIGSTLYTAYLCSLFGYGVWNTLLARYPTASVVPFTLLVPVSGHRHRLGVPRRAADGGNRHGRPPAPAGRARHPPSRDAGRRLATPTRRPSSPAASVTVWCRNPTEAFTG